MKNKAIALGIILILIIAGGLVSVQAGKGNNAPSGKHYTLNILGKNWEKGEPIPEKIDDPNYNPVIKGDNGHRIFVRLEGKTRIMLQEAIYPESFDVIDADGTDGKAIFQLPKPYAEDDTDFSDPEYTVWIRVLSPSGSASMYTTIFNGSAWIESTLKVPLLGQKGKKIFQDVTTELTTITADIDGDGKLETFGLFDDDLEGVLWAWDYDNLNLKHAQIRFYLE